MVQLIGLFSPPLPRHQSIVHSSVPPFNGPRVNFLHPPNYPIQRYKDDHFIYEKNWQENIRCVMYNVRRDPGEADDDAPHHQVEIRRGEQTHSLAGRVQ